jgi:hypothetical protein
LPCCHLAKAWVCQCSCTVPHSCRSALLPLPQSCNGMWSCCSVAQPFSWLSGRAAHASCPGEEEGGEVQDALSTFYRSGSISVWLWPLRLAAVTACAQVSVVPASLHFVVVSGCRCAPAAAAAARCTKAMSCTLHVGGHGVLMCLHRCCCSSIWQLRSWGLACYCGC